MKSCVTTALILSLACPVLAASEEIKPGILRTPDARFENLPGYDFEPHYIEIGDYRVHYLDEGPADGEIVLLLHGEPTWSYLYRTMIPVLTEAGYRSIVPDLIGFGRSDKPVSMDTHTFKFHVDAMATLHSSVRTGAGSSACVSWPKTNPGSLVSSSQIRAYQSVRKEWVVPPRSCDGRR